MGGSARLVFSSVFRPALILVADFVLVFVTLKFHIRRLYPGQPLRMLLLLKKKKKPFLGPARPGG